MANWWDAAPLADSSGGSNWWDSAPLVSERGNGGVVRTPQEAADALNLPIPGTDWRTPEQPVRFKSPIPGADFLNEAANQFARNMPVAGPIVDRAANTVGSNIAASIAGGTAEEWQRHAANVQAQESRNQPVASAAGTVAGAAGPIMAFGATKLGGQVLGNTGTMPQRIAAGGVSGGVLTGADAYARGATPEQALWSMLYGFGAGAGAPIAERVVMPAVRAVFGGQTVSRPVNSVAQNLERANIDPASIPQRIADLGPDAMMLDLDRNLARQAAAVAAQPGAGASTLDAALTSRAAGTNARIQGDVNTILGPSPVPSRIVDGIDEGRAALSPAYTEVLQNAKAVDTSSIALNLDSKAVTARGSVQKYAKQIRDMLNVPGTDQLDADPSVLLQTRHAIDQMFPYAQASGEQAFLTETRRQIDDLLGKSVPGIKQVDAQYEELARQAKGVGAGQNVLDNGKTAIRPEELEELVAAGVQPQGLFVGPSGETFRVSQGARAEIDRIIGTKANNLTALKDALKGDGSWNRARLITLFGKEKADGLLDVLERETNYQRSYNLIMGNSETAARAAAIKEASPAQFDFDVQKLLFGVPQKLANAAASARSESANAQIAQLLANPPTPEVIDQMIAARLLNRGYTGAAAAPLLINQQ